MVYTTLFLIGLVGLAALGLLGWGGHGHVGQAQGHGGHGHGGHSHNGRGNNPFLVLLSPLTWFSLCLGIGAVGLLLRTARLPGTDILLLSLLGGLLFYALLIKPLMAFVFRFASDPARALEGAVATTAEALTHFDTQGKGLVRLTVDGQIVRVLAYLEPEERAEAASVQPGDQLTIISVDGRANTCRVARL